MILISYDLFSMLPSAWHPPSSVSRSNRAPVAKKFYSGSISPIRMAPTFVHFQKFYSGPTPHLSACKITTIFDIRKPAHIFWCIFPPHGAHLRPFPEISFWVKITKSSFFPPKYLHISNICSTFALAFSYQLPIRPIGFPYHSHRIPIG